MVEDILGEESLRKRGIFKPEEVRKLIELDRQGKEDYSYPVFALLCIELWCRIFLDKKDASVLDTSVNVQDFNLMEPVEQ
jgi:asparagine synthase (glutamine-hydrolysing)